jgi:hypothetical protein
MPEHQISDERRTKNSAETVFYEDSTISDLLMRMHYIVLTHRWPPQSRDWSCQCPQCKYGDALKICMNTVCIHILPNNDKTTLQDVCEVDAASTFQADFNQSLQCENLILFHVLTLFSIHSLMLTALQASEPVVTVAVSGMCHLPESPPVRTLFALTESCTG